METTDPLFDLNVPLETLGLGSASPVGGEAAAEDFKIVSKPYAGGWWRSIATNSAGQAIAQHDSTYLSEAVTECRKKAEAAARPA